MNEARTTQFSRSTNSLGSDLNEAFTIEIESKTEEHATLSERDSSCISRSSKKRLVYCGDGVLEEDEDEEEEKERREAEEKQKAIELRKKQDLEAVGCIISAKSISREDCSVLKIFFCCFLLCFSRRI